MNKLTSKSGRSSATSDAMQLSVERRAMTLLQLLVALSLAIVLLGAIFLFLGDLIDSRERARVRSAREDAIAALFERLEGDLATAIAGDRSLGAGIKGDATSLSVLTRGVLPDPRAPRRGLGDLQRHEFRHDRAAQSIVGTRSAPRGGAGAAAAETIVFDGVVARVRFRYHDGQRWLDAFDSVAAGGLPAAVEVAVWFELPPAGSNDGLGDGGAQEVLDEAPSDQDMLRDTDSAREPEERDDPALPRPDRLRVITVPDGGVPVAARGEQSDGGVQ